MLSLEVDYSQLSGTYVRVCTRKAIVKAVVTRPRGKSYLCTTPYNECTVAVGNGLTLVVVASLLDHDEV